MGDSDSCSTTSENNNVESGKKEEGMVANTSSNSGSIAVKPTSKKTESWPRFSYTGSLGGTLQVFNVTKQLAVAKCK